MNGGLRQVALDSLALATLDRALPDAERALAILRHQRDGETRRRLGVVRDALHGALVRVPFRGEARTWRWPARFSSPCAVRAGAGHRA